MPSSAAPTRGWTASCASPTADAAAVRARGGHALLAPNGVDDAFFAVRRRRASACCSSAPWTTRRTAAGSSASWPRDGPSSSGQLPGARLQIAGPGSERFEGGLGVVDDLPALLGHRARGRRADLGGRRHAPEGARGARRRTRGGVDAARRRGDRLRARAPRRAGGDRGGAGGGAGGRARGPRGRSVPRGASSPSASAGRTRSPPPRSSMPGRAHVRPALADTERVRAHNEKANPSRGGDAKPRDPHGSAGLPKGAST